MPFPLTQRSLPGDLFSATPTRPMIPLFTWSSLQRFLGYEPSWFAEFMSAMGMLGWGVLSCLTTDYHITGWAWFMPLFGMVFGVVRVWPLFTLSPMLRVLTAAVGILWWGWLTVTQWRFYGPIPGEAGFAALFVGDVLGMAKFSVSAILLEREIRRRGA